MPHRQRTASALSAWLVSLTLTATLVAPGANAQTNLVVSAWSPPTHALVTEITQPWMRQERQ